MRKILLYVAPVIAGLLVGLVALALLGVPGNKSGPAVVSTSSRATSSQPQAPVTPSPAATAKPAVTAVVTPKVVPPAAVGTEYLALGDSVAYGVGAPVPTEQGYAGLFYANYLKRIQPDLQVYRNLAVPGETSATFLANPKGKSQWQRALEELEAAAKAGRRVSPVTLTVGGNDMLDARGKSNSEREAALARFEQNYSRILDNLKASAEGAQLIATTYYNPYAFQTDGEDLETGWVRRFNEVIRKQATGHGATVADFYAAVTDRERAFTWIGVGDVHPNQTGHGMLAQAVWKATGYDGQPPVLTLTYSSLPEDGKVATNGRLAFKFSALDEWGAAAFRVTPDFDTAGAGVVTNVAAVVDDNLRTGLTPIPVRLSKTQPGAQEFSYLVDTTQLASGRHKLRFEASDLAGNVGSIELIFEIS